MRRWQLLAVVLLIFGLVGCDHATKHLAATELRGTPTVLVPGVLELTYAENRDSAFSLLHHAIAEGTRYRFLLGAMTLGSIVAALGLVVRWRRSSFIEKAAMATLLGGALGNLGDRAVLGYVVDWVHLTHWPVFNVADLAITCGIGLLWLASRREGTPSVPAPPAAMSGGAPRGT
jgi:signal peptidase II